MTIPLRLPQLPSRATGDGWGVLLMALGFGFLVVPTLWRLSQWVWPSDDQGHGPLVLAVSLALLVRRWAAARAASSTPTRVPDPRASAVDAAIAWAVIGVSLPLYVVGRSQAILMAEVGSLITLVSALLLQQLGRQGLKMLAFPLAFLLFMIPLPEALVAAVTAPMKSAVSTVAAWTLQGLGQPVARSGVMLTAGPYQLLVADACAGLTTLFTLEAMGLLYLHLRGYTAWWRNVVMAMLVVPISFMANVLRVMTLVMVTLRWGDAAGQGYAHDFAGVTLFTAALILLIVVDAGLAMGQVAWEKWAHGHQSRSAWSSAP
ncbi:MAG: exosortase B [Betaproteobacteria bacterium]|jgi:exosortase B|nr:exosortase B [Betaproteobacteria bacterium]NBT11018.1 exosortase B [Betaproteobacteria bacterium]NBU49843.1 exosortase B [Betaproteobacteria bacterium]